MAIDVTCPCGRKMISADKYAGRMTKCPACGRQVRIPEAAAQMPASPSLETHPGELKEGLDRSRKVIKRYRDAYRVAAFVITVGDVVKFFGVLAGACTLMLPIILSKALSFNGEPTAAGVIGGIITGCITGFVIFAIGTLISAAGQLLLATLDSAVHSSPFLSDEERAKAMSV